MLSQNNTLPADSCPCSLWYVHHEGARSGSYPFWYGGTPVLDPDIRWFSL